MRKTFIALAATIGLIGLGGAGASATPIAPHTFLPQAAAVHRAAWYCGPRCRYWHHRHWEARRHWRWEHRRRYYGRY